MNAEQHKQLGRLGYAKADYSEMCRRVHQKAQEKDGQIHALVLATDMAVISDAIKRSEPGAWQELFREILGYTVEPQNPPTS